MSENKYHIRIARDETRSMGRAERLWYKGTAKWFLLFGLIVLAGVGSTLAYMSVRTSPVPRVSGARIINPIVKDTAPHFYLKIESGSASIQQSNQASFQKAKNGAILESGDRIKTDTKTYVTLISNQNSILRLGPNSALVFNDVSAPSEKIFQTNAKLDSGQLWANIVTKKDEKVAYTISTRNFLVSAQNGTFSVENSSLQRVSSQNGKVNIKEISDSANSDSILKDSVTHEYALDTGKTVTYTGNGTVQAQVVATPSTITGSYWWTWNVEQDAAYKQKIANAVSEEGPPLALDDQAQESTGDSRFYTVSGRTSLDARIFVNNFEIQNNQGAFSYQVTLPNLNTTKSFNVNVVCIDSLGNRTEKTVTLTFGEGDTDVVASNGVGLNLASKSVVGGVELTWNKAGSGSFDGYHVVRSEKSSDISYPKDDEYGKITDSGITTYLDANAQNNTKYFYRVCVKSGAGRFDCSNVVEVTFIRPPAVIVLPGSGSEGDGSGENGGGGLHVQ